MIFTGTEKLQFTMCNIFLKASLSALDASTNGAITVI